jgi:hypothetical protein
MMFEPNNAFEFAISEVYDLTQHGVPKRSRLCLSCKRYSIAHKSAANRGGNQEPQRICNDCGSKARSRLRRDRLMTVGARGRTGHRVCADPRYAAPSVRGVR